MLDIIIIGAGVTGCMIARHLSQYKVQTLVIEKENDVGNFSSMANSAIIHSGYDPEPGTLKAKLNVEGNKMFDVIAQELDVTFKRIGALTVALADEQIPLLKELQKRARVNGVDVQLLGKDELLRLEPRLRENAKMALYSPTTGIIDPFNLCVHAMENAIDNGVNLVLNEEVIKINKIPEGFIVTTNKNQYQTKIVINASGVQGDVVDAFLGDTSYKITPRKGEYFVLDHFDNEFIRHIIFPLPSSKGKGILLTPTSSNNYIIGPTSEIMDSREDLSTDKLTLDEIKSSAMTMVKDIPFSQVIRTFAGLRATANTQDFIIEEKKGYSGFINVIGIESPGLASSPAIAKMVVEEYVAKMLPLIPKENYNPAVKKYITVRDLPLLSRKELIQKNPLYGKIVCHCEQVSEQEIIDVLLRSCPPNSLKGVKKRVRAGFGKCQGSMCQSAVLKLLAKYRGIPLDQVPYDAVNTIILKQFVKGEKK